MNLKLVIIGVIGIVVVGAIGLTLFGNSEPEAPEGTYVDEDYVPTRPDVQARPNTFNVMTPEEKAAAEAEEARIAAEAALSASSTATTTATTTESTNSIEADIETE